MIVCAQHSQLLWITDELCVRIERMPSFVHHFKFSSYSRLQFCLYVFLYIYIFFVFVYYTFQVCLWLTMDLVSARRLDLFGSSTITVMHRIYRVSTICWYTVRVTFESWLCTQQQHMVANLTMSKRARSFLLSLVHTAHNVYAIAACKIASKFFVNHIFMALNHTFMFMFT